LMGFFDWLAVGCLGGCCENDTAVTAAD
jgi:hypothetical protein